MDEKKGAAYFIRIAGTLFAIAAVMALALSVVNGFTKDRIEANNKAEMEATISEIFGDGIEAEAVDTDAGSPVVGMYKITLDGSFQGWAVHASPVGFKAAIDMIVGVSPDGSCKAVKVISLSETPGLGAKVAEDGFLTQFGGKSSGLEIKTDIAEVAGATISSRTVVEAVNAALDAAEAAGGDAQ